MFSSFPSSQRSKYNHNTDLFVFDLPNKDAALDLPVASYVVCSYKDDDGKDVMRPYTPISQHEKGTLTLLVKDYPEGKMSKHFHQMKEGEKLALKGPLPKMAYKPNSYKSIGMIAGGTGITPCLQVLEEILNNPADKTQVKLVFANTSSKDILLREQIDALAAKDSRLMVQYVIDKAESGWKGKVGYLTAPLLKETLFAPSDDSLVLVCGPPGFMKAVSGGKTPDYKQGELTGALKELGFTEKNVMKM